MQGLSTHRPIRERSRGVFRRATIQSRFLARYLCSWLWVSRLLCLFSGLCVRELCDSVHGRVKGTLVFRRLYGGNVQRGRALYARYFFLCLSGVRAPTCPRGELNGSRLACQVSSPFLSRHSALLAHLPIRRSGHTQFLLRVSAVTSQSLVQLGRLQLCSCLLLWIRWMVSPIQRT